MKNPALTGGGSLQSKLCVTRLLLALVPHRLANRSLVAPPVEANNPRAPRPHPTTLGATRAGIALYNYRLVTLFKSSTTCATAYFGGITMGRWTWSRSTLISSRNQIRVKFRTPQRTFFRYSAMLSTRMFRRYRGTRTKRSWVLYATWTCR